MQIASSIAARPRAVAWWLFAVAAMVAVMVALGGVTRLTGSGLSMVEWNPHHFLPPLSHAEWQAEFAKYRATPEYRLVNAGMDLAGFQSIFWLEYIHRLWGRLIGLAFAVPLVVFALRGVLRGALARRLVLLLALGAAQGAMGWFMVASGLVDRPDVSHFRLAAHLVLAVVILAALLWTALDLMGHPPAPTDAVTRRLAWGIAGLVLGTITWGALVAGLDAGLVYNTFPLMNGSLLPDDGLNILADHGAVQFAHRMLAVTTVLAVTALGLRCRHRPFVLAALWVWVQAGLGVATLLLQVPVALAAAHQMGAIVLAGLLTWGLHSLRRG